MRVDKPGLLATDPKALTITKLQGTARLDIHAQGRLGLLHTFGACRPLACRCTAVC